MFGYVTINKSELPDADYKRFQSYYCGLCRVLKEKYRKRGQVVLAYDMTFLVVLLTSLYECGTQNGQTRCVPNRGKKHSILVNEMTSYAADMNLALAYHKCLDNWKDDHSHSQHMLAKMLEDSYQEIRQKYARQCGAMERELRKISELENPSTKTVPEGGCWKERAFTSLLTAPQEGDVDIDSAANCFGRLTAEIFVYKEDEWKETLWDMGFYLGKFIYLMDAYDDLEKDRKKGCYNPLFAIVDRKDFEGFCHQMFVMIIADFSRKFETLPLLEDIGILRNIIYSGIWTKYETIKNKKKKDGQSSARGQDNVF